MDEKTDRTEQKTSEEHNVSERDDTESTPSTEDREYKFKILVIGDSYCGKTSIVKRFVENEFKEAYRTTIGVDYFQKIIKWDPHTKVKLNLWDIAGQDRYIDISRVFYTGAVGAILVFDLMRPSTFNAVVKWKIDLDLKARLPDGTRLPCVLMANKCDTKQVSLWSDGARLQDYCRRKEIHAWYETSAKENINVDESVGKLIERLIELDVGSALRQREQDKLNESTITSLEIDRNFDQRCCKC